MRHRKHWPIGSMPSGISSNRTSRVPRRIFGQVSRGSMMPSSVQFIWSIIRSPSGLPSWPASNSQCVLHGRLRPVDDLRRHPSTRSTGPAAPSRQRAPQLLIERLAATVMRSSSPVVPRRNTVLSILLRPDMQEYGRIDEWGVASAMAVTSHELRFAKAVPIDRGGHAARLESVQAALEWIECEAPPETRQVLEEARLLLVLACGTGRRMDIRAGREALLSALRQLKLQA